MQFMRAPALLALAAIVVAAAALRLWSLEQQPIPIHIDEAYAGVAAWRIQLAVENARFSALWDLAPVHATSAALFVEYASLKIFGAGAWQLRLGAALYGTLSVVGAFLLLRALIDEPAGLFAAALTAFLHVPLAISRLGLPNVQAMCLVLFAAWLLAEALRRESWRWFAACGAVTALGLYSYLGFRAFVVVLPLAIAAAWLSQWRAADWRRRGTGILALVAAFLIIGAPLVWRAARGDEAGIEEAQRLSLLTTPEPFHREYGTDNNWEIFRRQVDKNLRSTSRAATGQRTSAGRALGSIR